LSFADIHSRQSQAGAIIMRSLILWLIGIPIPVIILIWLFVD
jgi:hypothetical protein